MITPNTQILTLNNSNTNNPPIHHNIIEINVKDSIVLSNAILVEKIRDLAYKLQLHIVKEFTHFFEPHGTSVIFILEESHLAVHYWPEKFYLHFDLLTCQKNPINLELLSEYLNQSFQIEKCHIANLIYQR